MKVKKSVPHAKGIAAHYMTRNQALKKLQVSLKDFRRLCILKGIYPRDPSKKKSGKDKVYYAVRDITFLAHEPLLRKFRDTKAWLKKYKRAINRHEDGMAENILLNKPVYTLDHLVRERYPTFDSALGDLDDALSMIHLFAALPSNAQVQRKVHVVPCERLAAEWTAYCTQTRSVSKVFVAVKGIYTQASIRGRPITYLVPHETAQQNSAEGLVDYKILLTFLDFYMVLMRFVLVKLYKDAGLSYPPQYDEASSTVKLEQRPDAPIAEKHDDGFAEGMTSRPRVFEGLRFTIGRECPKRLCSLVVAAAGGIIDDANPTHVVCDRPVFSLSFFPALKSAFASEDALQQRADVIQPQWLVDSFNWRHRLPASQYAIGATLPPHLSPFVDYTKEGYVPDRYRELVRLTGGDESLIPAPETQKIAEETVSRKRARAEAVKEDEDDDDEEESDEDDDLEEEGVLEDKKPSASQKEEEDRERRKLMMSRKKQKLYKAMQIGKERKQSQVTKLVKNKAAGGKRPKLA